MNLPEGWKISQLKPEHPTTQYADFKGEIVNESARSLELPFNVASGNSSEYNFASGRLDWQQFFQSVNVERSHCEYVVLDVMFETWLAEARLIPGYLPLIPSVPRVPRVWHWDAEPIIDELKAARSAEILFERELLDEERYWGAQGLSMEEAHARLARARQSREQNGLTVPMANQVQVDDAAFQE